MAIEHRNAKLTERRIRAVFDSNVYVAAYLSKNPRSPNKELFRDGLHFLYVVRGDTKPA